MAVTRDNLWWLAAPPAIWIAHFGAAYATVALWCAKGGGAGTVAGWIAAFTAIALAGLGGTAWRGARRWRAVPADLPDADSDAARVRFLALATLLLSGLAALGIAWVALAYALTGTCA